MGVSRDWPVKFTQDTWAALTEDLEGGAVVNHMFMVQDAQVATGFGITWNGRALAPQGKVEARRLSWTFKAGHPNEFAACTVADIDADYDAVLDAPASLHLTNGHLEDWRKITKCRTSKSSLLRELYRRVVVNARTLRTLISNFDRLPADAQLCVISMSWAVGPNWDKIKDEKKFRKFANFRQACEKMDFVEAAKYAGFESKENTLQKRARNQQQMLVNADAVSKGQGNFDECFWPGTVPFGAPAIDSAIEGRPTFGATSYYSLR